MLERDENRNVSVYASNRHIEKEKLKNLEKIIKKQFKSQTES